MIKRSSVQASLPSLFLGIQPEFLIAGVRWQVVSRLEEIGYGNRFVWILQRYRQRDEQLQEEHVYHFQLESSFARIDNFLLFTATLTLTPAVLSSGNVRDRMGR